MDEDLEKERNQAIMSATFTLLQNMEKNGDLNPKVTQQGIQKFQRASSDLDKKLDQEYKDEVALIYAELSKKNRVSTLQGYYNRVNFLQNIYEKPHNCLLGFSLWLIIYLSSCNDVCNIMLN